MSFKIRPLTAIAVALSALGLAQIGRVAFDASSAFAAGEPAKAVAKTVGALPVGDSPASGPPMCLPVDLAKEAGISAAEFRLLQSLQERRQTLDSRERDIVTRENVLKAADGRIGERVASLKLVEGNIQKLLGQVDDLEAARIASLVAVYEKMKPKDAARIFEGLEEEVLLKIAQRMKTQPMALILANMSGERARRITQRLAAIDTIDMSSIASQPSVAPATVAPQSPPRQTVPVPVPKAGQAAATAASTQQAATSPAAAAAPIGAGPNPPRVPDIRTPNPPTTPQPAARAASGQAPADPTSRPRAASGNPAPAKG